MARVNREVGGLRVSRQLDQKTRKSHCHFALIWRSPLHAIGRKPAPVSKRQWLFLPLRRQQSPNEVPSETGTIETVWRRRPMP